MSETLEVDDIEWALERIEELEHAAFALIAAIEAGDVEEIVRCKRKLGLVLAEH